MAAVKTLTYEKAVGTAYYLVEHILDPTWSPQAKRDFLIKAAPYWEQLGRAEKEAYRRSNDETLTALSGSLPVTMRLS